MKAKVSNTVLFVFILVSIALTGCVSMLDTITPAEVPDKAIEYLTDTQSDDVITNLKEAKKVQKEIVIKHRDTQIDLQRLAEDDKLHYSDALEVITFNIQDSQKMQDMIINGTGEIPGIQALLMGGIGLLVGRNFLKRPGDIDPSEVEIVDSNEEK